MSGEAPKISGNGEEVSESLRCRFVVVNGAVRM